MVDFPDHSQNTISSATEPGDKKLSVTDATDSVSFTKTQKSIIVYNEGSKACHFNLNAAATLNNFKLPARSAQSIDLPTDSVHAICASGETCTLYIRGIR